MGPLGTIAFGAGLRDALNPCVFMTCAIFILYSVWTAKYFSHSAGFQLLFILVYLGGTFFFNFSPIGILLYKKPFIFMAKVTYLILGTTSFIVGILFMKDWFQLWKGASPSSSRGQPPSTSCGIKTSGFILMTIVLVALLSAIATLWPMNNYVALLGMGGFVNGQWKAIIAFLMAYTIASLWPLWFLWAFLGIKKMRPSLKKIVCAGVFFLASSTIIFIFR